MTLSLAQRAECIRAIDRARQTLKQGDRISFTSCPGTVRSATFVGWDGNWICSKTRSDIAARSIIKLNWVPVFFADPVWERYDPNTGRPFGDHGTAQQALAWVYHECEDTDLANRAEFLSAWQDGTAWEEWPEFYEWLEPWPSARASRAGGRLAAADFLP